MKIKIKIKKRLDEKCTEWWCKRRKLDNRNYRRIIALNIKKRKQKPFHKNPPRKLGPSAPAGI